MSTPVDTAAVSRRLLNFKSIDEAMADVEGLVAAERQGKLRTTGNWTAGQILGHLATWVDFSFDGVPFTIPFFVRWIMRPAKNRVLYKPMKPGTRIARLPEGTVGTDGMPFADGVDRFRKTFSRIKQECPAIPNALLGVLTHEEWISLHLRHAELHLSFMNADEK